MKLKQILRTNSKCYGDLWVISNLEGNTVTPDYTVAIRYNAEKPSEKELAYISHLEGIIKTDAVLPEVEISGAHFKGRISEGRKTGQKVYEIVAAVDPLIDPTLDAPIVRKRGRKPGKKAVV